MVIDSIPSNQLLLKKALQDNSVIDDFKEKELDQYIRLASIACHCPVSVIGLKGKEDKWFQFSNELTVSGNPLEIPFFKSPTRDNDIMMVEDTFKDGRFNANDFFQDNKLRFYAGKALIDPNGQVLGTICVMDNKPRKLSPDQKKALLIICDQVLALIQDRKNKYISRYFQNAFNLSDELICIVGPDGQFKLVNPSFPRILGFDEQYLLSASIFDIIPAEDCDIVKERIQNITLEKQNLKFSQNLKTKNGALIHSAWEGTFEPMTGNIFAIGRDITKEKEKERLLKISESKFRSFFENSQGLLFTHDLKGDFLSVNKFGANLMGLVPQEMIGKNLSDFVPKIFHPQIEVYLGEIKEKGRADGLLTTIDRNNQSKRVWLYNNVLEKCIEGNPYVIGNSIDITERLKLEKDILNTKELLNQTNQLARIGGWKVDLITGEITWTKVTRLIHEVGEDFELTQESSQSFFKNWKHRNKIRRLFINAIRHGESWDEKLKIVTGKGNEIWVRIIGKPVFEEERCVQIHGAFHDINEEVKNVEELKRREQMLFAISKATDELLSNNDFYVATNFSLEILGKAVAADRVSFFQNSTDQDKHVLTSHKFEWNSKGNESKSNDPEMQNIPIGAMTDHLTNLKQKKSHHFSLSDLEKSSSVFRYLSNKKVKSSLIIPIFNNMDFWGFLQFDDKKLERKWSKAEISLLNSFSNSISNAIDRNFLERSLVQAKELAESASKAKSDFLANMSHEIRTPLNGVVGFTDLLLKTELTKTQAQYLNIVNESANTLLNTINEILDFSKIEAGRLELEIERCDLYELVRQVADVVSFGAHHKDLEMLLNISPNLPQYAYIDEIRIKQILINLLGNAIKFTEKGEVELKIYLLNPLEKGECPFRFEVRDTGVGIAKNKQTKIMEAFSQEDGSITKKYGGTGLGLSISNKLLSLMGTHLQLTSTPGQGSTFFFDLSLRCEQGTPPPTQKFDLIRKALIVDDNESNRSIIKALLHFKKIEVHEAKNGEEAFQKILSNRGFDIILMDYQMPDMNGLETIKKIKGKGTPEEKEPLFILMHDAPDLALVLDSCRQLDLQHQLVKPLKPTDLYNIFSHANQEIAKEHLHVETGVELPDQDCYRVLIAEDNPTNMLLARILIERLAPNVTVVEALNGLEALNYCKKGLPSIVLMDIQMPVMNGYEAAEAILQLPHCSKVPIIALSAGNILGEREKSLEVGMVDFLPKPIIEYDIKTAFGKWLFNENMNVMENTAKLPAPTPSDLKDEEIHVNMEKVKEYLGDDPMVIRELFSLTLQELHETPARLIGNINQGNIKGIREAGHKLKGSCMIAGLEKLLVIARSFENMQEFAITEADHRKAELLEETEIVKNKINEYLDNK